MTPLEHLTALGSEGLPEFKEARFANTQTYHNNEVSKSEVAQEMRTRPDRFFNSRDPNLQIQEEKSQHLVVVILKAQGKTQKEISELTGFTMPWVSQILRQPWAKKRLLDELRAAGQDAVRGRLAIEAVDSVETVINLRDDPKAPAAVRLNAANSLLDRHLGKATQHVESNNTNTNISFDSIEEMQKRLAQLNDAENALTICRKN